MERSVSGYRTKFRSILITTDYEVYANRGSGGLSPFINIRNILRIMEGAVGLTQAPVSTYRSETKPSRKIRLPELELLVDADGHKESAYFYFNFSLLMRQRSESPPGV